MITSKGSVSKSLKADLRRGVSPKKKGAKALSSAPMGEAVAHEVKPKATVVTGQKKIILIGKRRHSVIEVDKLPKGVTVLVDKETEHGRMVVTSAGKKLLIAS